MTGNESYLAGAILIDGANVLPVIRGLVKPEDFQVAAYRAIFTAAASLAADGEPVDPVSIQARARKQGVELSNQLLTELMEIVPTCTNAADYAHRVAEDARVRRIKELATRIQEDSVSGADELLATLQREAEDIRGSSYRRGLLSPADTLHRFLDFDMYHGTGLGAFRLSGSSIQEQYILKQERREEYERKRRNEQAFEEEADAMTRRVAARVASMSPEEKRAMLEKAGITIIT